MTDAKSPPAVPAPPRPPVFRLGARYVARRSDLLKWIAEMRRVANERE